MALPMKDRLKGLRAEHDRSQSVLAEWLRVSRLSYHS
jgi:DNA-binding XRE family transcriptional regulator